MNSLTWIERLSIKLSNLIVKPKMAKLTEEQKQRLEKRLQEIKQAVTPEDLSYVIWSKQFEAAVGDRSIYRTPFVEVVKRFKFGGISQFKHKTPKHLADDIWKPYLDEPIDEWFPDLRKELVTWIENYIKS